MDIDKKYELKEQILDLARKWDDISSEMLNRRIEWLKRELDRHRNIVCESINKSIGNIHKEFDKSDERIEALEERNALLEAELKAVSSLVHELKGRLDVMMAFPSRSGQRYGKKGGLG